MAETVTTEEAPAKRGVPLRLVIIGLVVIIGLAAAYVFVLAPSGEGEPTEPPPPEYSEEGGETMVVDAGTTMSLGGSERHYAMVTYSVRPAVDADLDAVPLEFPRMRSMVQRLLLGYEADELLTPDGVDRLEQDMSDVVAEIWPYGEIVDVYVENIVVQ